MYARDLALVTVSFSGLKKYSQEVAEGGAGARGNRQVLDTHCTLNKWHGQAKKHLSCGPRLQLSASPAFGKYSTTCCIPGS